ncbi:hypothetical protein GRI58_15240 [Porphyrobacter algicida]|uniref:DUF4175 domain-containing protein n=1 Tax=Qipengyuania algicida TaxID=1836209 RepID=A0A845ALX3_9SPHN|nr:hypothetical protein [Qipengyuania algicida]MXP30163.1 hypothetical protein [Qipengyuania algicida]
MIVIAALLVLFAAALCARLLFSLAIYALPLWVGGAAAQSIWQAGATWTSAAAAGLGAAFFALVLAHLRARSRSIVLRAAIAGLFALSAAIAGYYAAHGLAVAMLPGGIITILLSLASAALIGGAAGLRILNWGDAASKV